MDICKTYGSRGLKGKKGPVGPTGPTGPAGNGGGGRGFSFKYTSTIPNEEIINGNYEVPDDSSIVYIKNITHSNDEQILVKTGFVGQFILLSTLATDNQGNIYAGGFDVINISSSIYKLTGSTWLKIANCGLESRIFSMIFDEIGNLYVGGTFLNYNSPVLKLNGSEFIEVGLGLTGTCLCLAFDSAGNLYAGGILPSHNNIAKLEGTNWVQLGSGLDDMVYSIDINLTDNIVYAGGAFTNYITNWNGTNWTPMLGIDDDVFTVKINQVTNEIYIGGKFILDSVNYVAKWIGTNWVPIGNFSGIDPYGLYVRALVIDEQTNVVYIYRDGNGVSKLNGSTWDPLITAEYGTVLYFKNNNLYFGVQYFESYTSVLEVYTRDYINLTYDNIFIAQLNPLYKKATILTDANTNTGLSLTVLSCN